MARFDDLNKVFSIEENTPTEVIVKVLPLSLIDVAKHPFVSADWAYITVTKGKNHVLSVIKQDGTKGVSFEWGKGGYTLISNGLEDLKQAVCLFVERDSAIMLDVDFESIKEATICYNSNFKKWELIIDGLRCRSGCYFSEIANSKKEMFADVKRIIKVDGWIESTAPTGIAVWIAINPRWV